MPSKIQQHDHDHASHRNEAMTSTQRIPVSLALVLALLAAAGCGGGGGGGVKKPTDLGATAPSLHIRGIAVSGTTAAGATVTVNGLADSDATADTDFLVTFALDGGGDPGDLAVDAANGTTRTIPFTVSATAGGPATTRSFDVVLDP